MHTHMHAHMHTNASRGKHAEESMLGRCKAEAESAGALHGRILVRKGCALRLRTVRCCACANGHDGGDGGGGDDDDYDYNYDYCSTITTTSTFSYAPRVCLSAFRVRALQLPTNEALGYPPNRCSSPSSHLPELAGLSRVHTTDRKCCRHAVLLCCCAHRCLQSIAPVSPTSLDEPSVHE